MDLRPRHSHHVASGLVHGDGTMRHLSVFSDDDELLKALSDIHLKGKWFDLDCTYSQGIFYKNIEQPKLKSDIDPIFTDVIKSDSRYLHFLEPNSIESIVFDPPFLFRNRKSKNGDKISKRFSYFEDYYDLKQMYFNSMDEFNRVLKLGGYIFFKCQDMTDGKFYCTHNAIINASSGLGFELKDIAIKATKKKLQKDAIQQNCVAKVHSYWLVFKKVENHEHSMISRERFVINEQSH